MQQRVALGVGRASASYGHAAMVGARSGAWLTWRQFIEHVACAGGDKVGS